MFIKYNNSNIHAMGHIEPGVEKNVASGPKAIHWLRPGWNEFPSNIWAMYETHPEILKMIKEKKIEILDEKVEVTKGKKKVSVPVGLDDAPIKLTDFSESRAIEIVKECFNRDILQRWVDEDTRAKVKRALDEQIKPLQKESQKAG